MDTEREVPMRVVLVHLDHSCGGEWRSLGHGMSNNAGSNWLHKCSKCGEQKWFDATYPARRYKERPRPKEEQ